MLVDNTTTMNNDYNKHNDHAKLVKYVEQSLINRYGTEESAAYEVVRADHMRDIERQPLRFSSPELFCAIFNAFADYASDNDIPEDYIYEDEDEEEVFNELFEHLDHV